MQLVCPKCGVAITGADIDLGRGIGVCRPCGELVPLPSAGVGGPFIAPTAAAVVYRPEDFRIVEDTSDTRYVAAIAPSRLAALPLLFFALFWDGFMIVWYAIAITGHVWVMGLFGLLHLGVGIAMTYSVLVKLFNTTRLRIENGRLHFGSGPIPKRGKVDLPVDAIDSFTVGSKLQTTRNTERMVFFLEANLAAGTKKQLPLEVDDQPSLEYACYRFNEALANAKRRIPQGPYRD